MASNKEVYKKRLLNVAKALRESKSPQAFTMYYYVHSGYTTDNKGKVPECGTPACALGHYAARRDLQRTLYIDSKTAVIGTKDGRESDYGSYAVLNHFGLDHAQSEELFGGDGCGFATSVKQAALYIERFVKKNFK